MFIVVTLVEVIFEMHYRIRATGRRVAVKAAQAGTPQPRFAREIVDAITPETPLNSLAVEDNGFGCAGA